MRKLFIWTLLFCLIGCMPKIYYDIEVTHCDGRVEIFKNVGWFSGREKAFGNYTYSRSLPSCAGMKVITREN